jgi:hypothetical protein
MSSPIITVTAGLALTVGLLAWAVGLPRLARLAYRFLAGHHLAHGRSLTDGSWTRPATRALTPYHVRRYWHRPGWHRSAFRLAALAVLAVAGAVSITGSPWLWATLALVVASGLSAATWRAFGRWRDWRHLRVFVRPLARALAPLLGIAPRQAVAAVRFPRTYAAVAMGELGRIVLPDTFHPDQQRAVTLLIKSRLPVDADLSWRLTGKPLFLQVNASPKPPDRVAFADLAAEMDACLPGDVVIGLDRKRTVFRGSFRTEDPHWALSMGSGRGKSSLLYSVAAQILHQDPGATVTAVDPKMTSLDALVGVPGFTVANDPRNVPAMWGAIESVATEMERRMDITADNPTAEFPVCLLVIDELNQFSAMTAAVWRGMKEKGDPATAPIWMVLAGLLWQGRAFNVHVIVVGQRLDERATGGIGLRDSFGLRGLAGYTMQQWAMLVGTTPIPRSQKPRGRIVFWDGSDVTWVQAAYGTPEELRDYAMHGRRAGVAAPAGNGPYPGETAGTATDTAATWVVGLDAGAGHLGLSPAAFRKRRERAGGTLPGEVRQGNQPAWTAADLDAWRETWPRMVSTS